MIIGKAIKPTRLRLACLAASLGVGLLSPVPALARSRTPDPTEVKIRLMSQALEAKDSGDFATAKARLAQLVKLVPNDPQVLRLIRDVDRLEKAAATPRPPAPPAEVDVPVAPAPLPAAPTPEPAPPVPTPAPSSELFPIEQPVEQSPNHQWRATDDDAAQLAADETSRLKDQMDRVSRRLSHAQDLVAEDRHQEALKELKQLSGALPLNPMTEPLLREIAALTIDVEHRARVASISLKDTPPVLSIQYGADAVSSDAAQTKTYRPRVDVELDLLVLPDPVVNDLWSAWMELSRSPQTGRAPLVLDRNGRPEYQRPLHALLSPTEVSMYRAIAAGAQGAIDDFSPLSAGTIGFSAPFDPAGLVRTLASLPDCRLLASPRLSVQTGQSTVLTLTSQSPDAGQGSRAKVDPLMPVWKVSLTPEAGSDSRVKALRFVLESSSYQGIVMRNEVADVSAARDAMSAQALTGVSRTSGSVALTTGETLVVISLPQTTWLGRPTERNALDRIPWLGGIHRADKIWSGAREVLLIVRLLPSKRAVSAVSTGQPVTR